MLFYSFSSPLLTSLLFSSLQCFIWNVIRRFPVYLTACVFHTLFAEHPADCSVEEQRSRGAESRRSRGAEDQRRSGAELPDYSPSPPPLLLEHIGFSHSTSSCLSCRYVPQLPLRGQAAVTTATMLSQSPVSHQEFRPPPSLPSAR